MRHSLAVMAVLTMITACGGATVQTPPGAVEWSAPHGQDHPLVGKIWSARAGAFVSEERLLRELGEAHYVLLGETHDNADHHALQARIVRGLGPATVGFEMLDETAPLDSTEAIERHWSQSGWPDFAIYRPIFTAAQSVGAEVVASHPTRAQVREVARGGLDKLPEDRRNALRLDAEMPQALLDDLAKELTEAHCGHGHAGMIAGMTAAQQLKDAWMAEALEKAGALGPAVLIAGAGHVRNDRGVPWWLTQRGVTGALSVAFLGVWPDQESDPAKYAPERFDYVWFTPRQSTEDPCERFRKQLEKMRKKHHPAPKSEAPAPAES